MYCEKENKLDNYTKKYIKAKGKKSLKYKCKNPLKKKVKKMCK